jgi:hypothetical protein
LKHPLVSAYFYEQELSPAEAVQLSPYFYKRRATGAEMALASQQCIQGNTLQVRLKTLQVVKGFDCLDIKVVHGEENFDVEVLNLVKEYRPGSGFAMPEVSALFQQKLSLGRVTEGLECFGCHGFQVSFLKPTQKGCH